MLIGGLLFLYSCSGETDSRDAQSGGEVIVKADVSLKPVLQEIAENYQRETTVPLKLQFAPSFELLADSSADSVDTYIFANDDFIESARRINLIDSTGEITLAFSVPCLLVPMFNPAMVSNLSDLKNPELRIGIPDPESDILGRFALEILRKNQLYKSVYHRLIINGPSALEMTERVAKCELDVAIGWTVCPNWNPGGIEVVLLIPSEVPRVAVICAAKAATPADSTNADNFMTYLKSDRSLHVFRKWGYMIADSDLDAYAPAAIRGGSPAQ